MGEEMDLFEALKDQAFAKILGSHGTTNEVEATIEALREMCIGEPLPTCLAHTEWITGEDYTEVFLTEQFDEFGLGMGHHGTNDEKVAVCVFRIGKKSG